MFTTTMAEPGIVSCQFDDSFQPRLLAMELDWRDQSAARTVRAWQLPEGVELTGPAPTRFGFEVLRRAADAYAVRLLWNHTCLGWNSLTRQQLLTTSLHELLAAMGTDLPYLLDQPILLTDTPLPRLKVG
jgi:hypothetical protein